MAPLLELIEKMHVWFGRGRRKIGVAMVMAALIALNLNGAWAADGDSAWHGPVSATLPSCPKASISGCVWYDDNGNGVQDTGEPGLSRVTVNLTWAGRDGTFGTGDDVTCSRDTDANGNYLFRHLPAGDYRVEVDTTTLPDEMAPTYDLDGTLDSTTDITLAAGESRTDVDFGYEGLAGPGALTLTSFAARSSAEGSASSLWLALAGLTVLAAGSLFWAKQRAS